ncbi:MAG TPA: Flp family type IVb pilin [Actinomycetes bacterium]|jgi:Flp pilus assembly pilin Flp|nr:Flp family type IVb pilin [Actinomycetes bacterium]
MLELSMIQAWIRARFGEMQAREQGITAVEYALMVAVVALLLVVGFFFLFTRISTKFSSVGSCVSNSPGVTTGC